MASWANIARTAAPAPAPAPEALLPDEPTRVAVVDANAIINGLRLEGVADRFYTVAEVLREVRDKQSRDFLATLPYSIELKEPSEDSAKAVLAFARATGDLQVLSAVDLKLLALAHTLEVAAHGSSHLRDRPVQARLQSKHRSKGKALPGWGRVDNPEDWKIVDETPDDPNTQGASSSRIATQLQALDINGAPPGPASTAVQGTAPLQDAASHADASGAAAAGAAAAAAPENSSLGQGTTENDSHDFDDGEDDEDDGWQTASGSRMAARHRKRKDARRAAWLDRQVAAAVQSASGPTQPAAASNSAAATATATTATGAPAAAEHVRESGSTIGTAAAEAQAAGPGASAPTPAQQQQQQHEGPTASAAGAGSDRHGEAGGPPEHGGAAEGPSEEGESSGAEEGDDAESDYDDEDEEEEEDGEEEEDDEDEDGEQDGALDDTVSTSGFTDATGTDGGQQAALPGLNTSSSVVSVSADFAMQNVLLQMGLRLLTRDGRQITRLSRWALRCGACSYVSKEVGKVFCPRCGNLTMERIEYSLGPDGAEYFGVRKKHVLRGTKYSLPKPKGGRHAKQPILCEDVMLQKTRPSRRKQKAAAAGTDVFAVEFTADALFQETGAQPPVHKDVLITNWKNNPNERRHIARNNRRK